MSEDQNLNPKALHIMQDFYSKAAFRAVVIQHGPFARIVYT